MKIKLLTCIFLVIISVAVASAKEVESAGQGKVKALTGMSIVGNDEAPKALYIVPWKSSEIGVETDLDRTRNINYKPVDREQFRRKVDYYYVSTTSNTGR